MLYNSCNKAWMESKRYTLLNTHCKLTWQLQLLVAQLSAAGQTTRLSFTHASAWPNFLQSDLLLAVRKHLCHTSDSGKACVSFSQNQVLYGKSFFPVKYIYCTATWNGQTNYYKHPWSESDVDYYENFTHVWTYSICTRGLEQSYHWSSWWSSNLMLTQIRQTAKETPRPTLMLLLTVQTFRGSVYTVFSVY